MTKETKFGLAYAAVFGLVALMMTILGVWGLKSPDTNLWHAWLATADAHSALLVLANIGGFVFGRNAAKRSVNG